MGEADSVPLQGGLDRRPKLEFHRSRIASDAGLLVYREPDDGLGPTGMTGSPWLDEGRPEAEKLIRYSMAAPSKLLSHRTSGYMGNVQ